jgi:hypothetical protein
MSASPLVGQTPPHDAPPWTWFGLVVAVVMWSAVCWCRFRDEQAYYARQATLGLPRGTPRQADGMLGIAANFFFSLMPQRWFEPQVRHGGSSAV